MRMVRVIIFDLTSLLFFFGHTIFYLHHLGILLLLHQVTRGEQLFRDGELGLGEVREEGHHQQVLETAVEHLVERLGGDLRDHRQRFRNVTADVVVRGHAPGQDLLDVVADVAEHAVETADGLLEVFGVRVEGGEVEVGRVEFAGAALQHEVHCDPFRFEELHLQLDLLELRTKEKRKEKTKNEKWKTKKKLGPRKGN